MKKYYSIVVQWERGDSFSVQFGDYDRAVVEQECEDAYSDAYKTKIIKSGDTTESISEAVNKLNERLDVSELITMQLIGNLELGIDGRDEYVLVTNPEGKLSIEQAEDFVLSRVYRNSTGAGSYYCTSAYGSPVKYSVNQVIVSVHHRYDI